VLRVPLFFSVFSFYLSFLSSSDPISNFFSALYPFLYSSLFLSPFPYLIDLVPPTSNPSPHKWPGRPPGSYDSRISSFLSPGPYLSSAPDLSPVLSPCASCRDTARYRHFPSANLVKRVVMIKQPASSRRHYCFHQSAPDVDDASSMERPGFLGHSFCGAP
jgi:hypothetical protein